MYAPKVDANGVLSWSTIAAETQDAHTGTAASTASVTLTPATCTITNGAVGISGGSITPVSKYMKHTNTGASTASVSWTAASLGTQNKADITYVKSATTSLAGEFEVTPSFTGTGTQLKFTGSSGYVAVTGTAAAAGSHTHSIGSSKTTATLSYVTSIKNVSSAGGYAVTPTFTGTEATLAHTVSTKSFSGTAATISVSASYQPAGTISKPAITISSTTVAVNTDAIKAVSSSFAGASVTLEQPAHKHSYTKPTAHTHSIELSDATITGTASVAVSAHTHNLGNHTHSVKVDPIKAAS